MFHSATQLENTNCLKAFDFQYSLIYQKTIRFNIQHNSIIILTRFIEICYSINVGGAYGEREERWAFYQLLYKA